MAAPVALRANYSDLFSSSALPALEMLFGHEYALHPSLRSQLFQIKRTERDIAQESELHDIQLFNSMQEGEDYSFVAQKQGANKTFSMQKYGLGLSFSQELIADGKVDQVAMSIRKLAESAAESREVSSMNVLNNGFSTETAWDGLSIFNSAHTLPSGGTYRNVPSAAGDLDPTTLETALIDFEKQFVGDGGAIKRIQPKILLVSSEEKRNALEIVGSDLKADTADNNMNSLKLDGLRVVSSPHLTDTDAWYLLADPMNHGLRIYERQAVQTQAAGPDVGFMNDSIFYKSSYREQLGCTHAFGVYGNAGA